MTSQCRGRNTEATISARHACDLGKAGVGRIHYGSPHEGQVRGLSNARDSNTTIGAVGSGM